METTEEGHRWYGQLEYPNDKKHIIITFVLLPIAAAAFAYLCAASAIWM